MTTFIKFTLGFIILACVISSYQDSQKALARIDQMEQTVSSIKSRGNQQGDFIFAASLDDRNRHDTWPDSVIVGKQYTAYVDEYAGPDAVTVGKQDSLTPVTVLIKGTIEEKQKIPVERALGDCWFCKK